MRASGCRGRQKQDGEINSPLQRPGKEAGFPAWWGQVSTCPPKLGGGAVSCFCLAGGIYSDFALKRVERMSGRTAHFFVGAGWSALRTG